MAPRKNSRAKKKPEVEDDEDVEYYMADLTEEERTQRALELADVSKRVLDLEAKRTDKMREFNAKLKKDKTRQRELIESVATGKERRAKQMELIEGGQAFAPDAN